MSLISELDINNPNINLAKVKEYWNSISIPKWNNHWNSYLKICKPYIKKYNISDDWLETYDFDLFSQSDLEKIYRELKQIMNN